LGIETLVIGRDPFAFVEIIRRLEAGATVALLMTGHGGERRAGGTFSVANLPPPSRRRSWLAPPLRPPAVYLPRTDQGYAAHSSADPYDARLCARRGATN